MVQGSLSADIQSLFENNGFTQMGTNGEALQFGAKTVNNLPLLFEVTTQDESASLTYKVPVMPLKPLLEDAFNQIFSSFKGE